MFSEFLLIYERDNLIETRLIELAKYMKINITKKFIEDEVFMGSKDNCLEEKYGQGKVFVFENNNTNEILIINTYLSPDDKCKVMELGSRCKSVHKNTIKGMLEKCFKEERLRPINSNLKENRNNLLLSISKRDKVQLAAFFNGIGIKDCIKVVKMI